MAKPRSGKQPEIIQTALVFAVRADGNGVGGASFGTNPLGFAHRVDAYPRSSESNSHVSIASIP